MEVDFGLSDQLFRGDFGLSSNIQEYIAFSLCMFCFLQLQGLPSLLLSSFFLS